MKEKIKVSINNPHLKPTESKRPFFDLTVFAFADPKIIIMRRYLEVTLDLRTYLLTYFNTTKLPL